MLRDNIRIEPFISDLKDPEQRKFVHQNTSTTLKAAVDEAELYEMTNGIEQKQVDSAIPPAVGNNGKKPVRALSTKDDWKSLKAGIIQEVRAIMTAAQSPPINRGRPMQSPTHQANSNN